MLIEYKNHKIFAFSDTHGLNHRLNIPKDVDILICAGDCLKEDNMVYVDNEFVKSLNWYSHQDAKLKIYVPGNHEVFFEMNPEKAMQMVPSSIVLLEDSGIEFDGISFFGAACRPWMFRETENKVPKGIDILITHGPAEGHLDNNTGCQRLRQIVEESKPKHHIFGHVHEEGDKIEATSETTYYNVSMYNQLKYHYPSMKENQELTNEILNEPIYEWVPVSTIADPNEKWQVLTCTQYKDFSIGSTGVIEIDILGLRTLSELKAAIYNIKKNLGIEFNLEKIPIDDPKTFKLFQQGQTIGVFMHESASLRTYLKHLHPTTIDDLVALFALYRPGSWDYIPLFINKKNGKEEIKYDIPCMEKYLKDTYGLTIYQEQIMLLSRQLADFSREESYKLQNAMGKRKKFIIDGLKPKFIERGKKNGHDPKVLEKIWSDWENYGWRFYMNLYAVSDAMIAYQTAYLKANFPYEYMTALLESRKDNKVEYDLLLEECMRMKLYRVFKDYQ